jgi:hypothetical protein
MTSGFAGTAGRIRTGAAALALIVAGALPIQAQPLDPMAVLQAMSDYVAAQETLRVTFDSDIEVITPALEKIQFTSSGDLTVARPDRLQVRRTGAYADAALLFDGSTATVVDLAGNRFARLPAEGTLEQLRDGLRHQGGMALPGADLLMSDAFAVLSADVIEAKHIGQGVIGGVTCEHLAFRNHDTDWQLWVATGDRPAPCRLIVTSKTVAAAPQYTLTIRSFEPGVAVTEDQFTFTPPAGATEVPLASLGDIDEIPPAAAPAN